MLQQLMQMGFKVETFLCNDWVLFEKACCGSLIKLVLQKNYRTPNFNVELFGLL